MQKQTLELANPDKTLIYKGEAGVVDDRFTLNGLGSLECRGFVDNQKTHYSCFNGIFVDSVRQGYSSITVTDEHGELQWRYEGVYKGNQPNGQGSLTVPISVVSAATGKQERTGDMQEFQGGFKQGLMEGFGQVTIEGKVTYSGQWRNGKPHGNGQATYIELNTTYTGGWVDGLWQGEGSLVHSSKFLAVHDNSKSYTIKGHFVKGNLDGEGSRTYASGKTIKGNWFDNELMTGKLYNVDGTTYEGEWLGGRPHGIGTKTISGGKRYEGMFFLGRPWGIGSKIDSSENREDGFWDGSKFIPGQVTEEQETEFKKQLKHATTYYHIFKKHYLTDLPKTNYDLVKEEHQNLGMAERQLVTILTKEFSPLIR